MIRRSFYLMLFVGMASCSSRNKVPSSVIQPQEMKSILWDIMSAQNMAATISTKDSLVTTITATKALTEKVFEIHKIAPADFNKSYEWYVKHPETLKIMLDSLYAQKQRENTLQFEKKSVRDSIQKKIPAI